MNIEDKERVQTIRQKFLEETGHFIARKRKYIGLNQSDLGSYMDVTGTTVSRYETGEIDMPVSNLAVISSVCGFPMYEDATAWNNLELKDIFKKSLELLRVGKRYHTERLGDITFSDIKSIFSKIAPEPDNQELNIMVNSCTEETAESVIRVGTTLITLKDENLKKELCVAFIENHIRNAPDEHFKQRMKQYYEVYTGRSIK